MSAPRLAFAGCGLIARSHLHGWLQGTDSEVVGLFDASTENMRAFGQESGVSPDAQYDDLREMLQGTAPGIVIVSTWTAHHESAVIACAEAGVRVVLCEKPFAASLGEIDRMRAACHASGTALAVGHQRRHYPSWQRAREYIAAGGIGEVTHVWTTATGGLMNSASHNIDLVRLLLGDPGWESVSASVHRRSDRYERGLRAEESALAMVRFDGGIRLFLESDLDESLAISANAVVSGTEGTLTVDEDRVSVVGGRDELDLDVWPALAEIADSERPVLEMLPFFAPDSARRFAQTFVDQARELRGWLDDPARDDGSSAANGRAVIELIMAMYTSARERSAVAPPFEHTENTLAEFIDSGDLRVEIPGRYDIRAVTAAESWRQQRNDDDKPIDDRGLDAPIEKRGRS
jgi:predicted dehydrogenase